jgi:hypothetical protein
MTRESRTVSTRRTTSTRSTTRALVGQRAQV